jgi:hypothetical protein
MKWSIGNKLAISFALLCSVTGIMAVMVIIESMHVRKNAEQLEQILQVRARLSRGRIEHLNWTAGRNSVKSRTRVNVNLEDGSMASILKKSKV